MKLFAPLYERTLAWSKHRLAPWYLGFLSFIEAIVFPVPPEVMLAPMTLAEPKSGWRFAWISLVGSILGALIGYALGYFALDLVTPWVQKFGYWDDFLELKALADEYGFWFLLIGGFMPVPFKIFTLASGAVGMPMLPFLAGAFIGRGKRVFILVWIIRWGGEKAERALHKHIEVLGWLALVLMGVLLLWLIFRT